MKTTIRKEGIKGLRKLELKNWRAYRTNLGIIRVCSLNWYLTYNIIINQFFGKVTLIKDYQVNILSKSKLWI